MRKELCFREEMNFDSPLNGKLKWLFFSSTALGVPIFKYHCLTLFGSPTVSVGKHLIKSVSSALSKHSSIK